MLPGGRAAAIVFLPLVSPGSALALLHQPPRQDLDVTYPEERRLGQPKLDVLATTLPHAVGEADGVPTESVPVVHIWFGSDPFPDYFEAMCRVSLRRNNVFVLTEHEQEFSSLASERLQYVDLKPFIEPSRHFFESQEEGAYQPWGRTEPWAAHNVQRAFALKEWMQQDHRAAQYKHVFFADCDVAVFSNMTEVFHEEFKGCQSAFAFQSARGDRSLGWASWVGSSFLSRGVLADFERFARTMYLPRYLPILELKRDNHPFVCDMTLWHLYAVAFGYFLPLRVPGELQVPTVEAKSTEICDTSRGGHFDHFHGWNLPGFVLDDIAARAFYKRNGTLVRLHTLHFLGGSKASHKTVLGNLLPSRIA